MDKPLFLRIFRGTDLIGIKQFNATQVVIGREGEADVKLEGEEISPIHAMIEKRENGFFLCDLGSESGVTLSGRKVLDEPIESGAEFSVGPYKIEFYEGIPKPKTKPPPVSAMPPNPKVERDEIYDQAGSPSTPVVPSVGSASADVLLPTEKKAETPPPEVVEKPSSPPPIQEKYKSPTPSESTKEFQDVEIPDRPVRPKENQVYHVSGLTAPDVASPSVATTVSTGPQVAMPAAAAGLGFHRKHATFAPPSAIRDLNETIKPEKGTTVEIVVAWKERILDTYHYNEKQTIKVGSHPKNDIVLPVFGSAQASHPLVQIESLAAVFLTPDMKGVYVKNGRSTPFDQMISQGGARRSGAGYVIDVQQGEMVRIDFDGGVSIYVRYISQAQKPVVGPLLDLSANELVNILIAVGLVAIFMLYVVIF